MMSTTASQNTQTVQTVAQVIAAKVFNDVGQLLPHVGLAITDKKPRSRLQLKLVAASEEWVNLGFAMQAQCSEATWNLSDGGPPTAHKLCIRCGLSVKRGSRLQVISPPSTVPV